MKGPASLYRRRDGSRGPSPSSRFQRLGPCDSDILWQRRERFDACVQRVDDDLVGVGMRADV